MRYLPVSGVTDGGDSGSTGTKLLLNIYFLLRRNPEQAEPFQLLHSNESAGIIYADIVAQYETIGIKKSPRTSGGGSRIDVSRC